MANSRRLITNGARAKARLVSDDRLVALIRRGEASAFSALYERHAGELLSFCSYMLRSRHDAEDCVQATFASAYRALRSDERSVSLRPWLFTIARNECLTTLRKRRPTTELNGEPALRGDPFSEVQLREEVRQMLDDLRGLPERQQVALLLADVHGFSHSEIGRVLDVRAEQVKAYLYQARSNLLSERQAREADCRDIREELADARGALLLRGRLRRHMRSCVDCRTYADGLARQRQYLGALVPLLPTLALKYRALEDALGLGGADPATYAGGATVGGSVAGAALELAGGGVKALAVKFAAGIAAVGVSAGVGVSVLSSPGYERPEAPLSTPSRSVHTRPTSGAGGPASAAVTADSAYGWSANAQGQASTQTASGEAAPADTAPGLGMGGGEAGGTVGAPDAATVTTSTTAPAEAQEASGTGTGHAKGQRDHQRQHEENEMQREARQHKRQAESQPAREERQREREENKREHEQLRREREQRRQLGAAGPPPKDKEERALEHEERVREHEERVRAREERRR